jgi:hypothetical protein
MAFLDFEKIFILFLSMAYECDMDEESYSREIFAHIYRAVMIVRNISKYANACKTKF